MRFWEYDPSLVGDDKFIIHNGSEVLGNQSKLWEEDETWR